MSLPALLVILLIVAVLFGGWGSYSGAYGPGIGWSPFGLLVALVLILLVLGVVRL